MGTSYDINLGFGIWDLGFGIWICLILTCIYTTVWSLIQNVTSLTLSNTKQGTDLGMLVVLLEQTFHPLHRYFCFAAKKNL